MARKTLEARREYQREYRKRVGYKTQCHRPRSPEYVAWRHMKQRCMDQGDKNYAAYGGRGISVCGQWLASFQVFLADMGPRPSPQHSIDRINNDGNYEPGNCRVKAKLASKFRGVYPSGRRWVARVGHNVYLGSFDTEESAARAYDDAARELFGEFARLNFPEQPTYLQCARLKSRCRFRKRPLVEEPV